MLCFLINIIYRSDPTTSPKSPPSKEVVPVLVEGIEDLLDRKWLSVDTSSVKGFEKCSFEVDSDECGGQPNHLIPFFQKASEVMHVLGGAIPSIVNHTLSDEWKKELGESINHSLDDSEDENASLTKVTDVLVGKRIRIFGKSAPYVPVNAEGNASWSFESDGKSAPDLDKAVLYIYIEDFQAVVDTFGPDSTANFSLGRARTLNHEFVHGIRIMKRLIARLAMLNWSQNQNKDWCIEKDQFSEIVTPPKLGPNPTPAQLNSGYPADAGRTWEHSITGGKAFFQGNFEVVIAVQGKFILRDLSFDEAKDVLARPLALIEISRPSCQGRGRSYRYVSNEFRPCSKHRVSVPELFGMDSRPSRSRQRLENSMWGQGWRRSVQISPQQKHRAFHNFPFAAGKP